MKGCPDCNWQPTPDCPTYTQHCRVCKARAARLALGDDLPDRTLSGKKADNPKHLTAAQQRKRPVCAKCGKRPRWQSGAHCKECKRDGGA